MRPEQQRKKLRDMGYQDGIVGREPRKTEPEYLTSYRRGKERRLRIDNELKYEEENQAKGGVDGS